MSAPSSDGDGRLSVSSSGPSATSATASSRTLNSRWSSGHEQEDNGEGSSQRASSAAGADGGRGASDAVSHHSRNSHDSRHSRDSGSPLGAQAIEEVDFAQRRKMNRRSGGFLLDSTFAPAPSTRQHPRQSLHVEDAKGKRSSRRGPSQNTSRHAERLQPGIRDSAGRPSPSCGVTSVDQHTVGDDTRTQTADGPGYDGQLHPPKTRNIRRELSTSVANRENTPGNGAPRAAMDPNQIINLALDLSESRRRNLSAGHLIPPQPTGSRRVASIGARQEGSFREPSGGGSLRQYLNEQRRISRNISPIGAKQISKINPSEETLARAAKFRASVDLRLEYFRLLEYLPPLKADVYAPGNFTVTANNVPGSPHAFLTRVPSYAGKKYDLGRPYNPLQYLRDRRTRARERKSLDHMPEDFSDPTKVRDWIDRVEEDSKIPGYRRQDVVALPEYHENHARDAVPSKSTRHRMGWNFTIEELIADALWLEQNGNKHLIEDRFGHKVFPAEEPKKQDFLQPRASKEYPEKRRKSWVDGLGMATDPTTGDESDPTSERGRKRRLLPAFRAESPRHKKHGWRGSVSRPGIHSDFSDSDSDVHSRRRHRSRDHRSMDLDRDPTINTGALGLHLKGMLEEEAKETRAKSPSVVSPDTPDKWGVGYRNTRESASPRSSMDTTGYNMGSIKGGSYPGRKAPPSNITLPSEPVRKARSSFDESNNTSPSTPFHVKDFAHNENGSSSPPSRGGDMKKSMKTKLDIFRSDDGVKGSKHDVSKAESESGNVDKKRTDRPAEDDFKTTVKSLLSHKHNESVSSVNSPVKQSKDYKETKDPSSAVGRFFKGVKNEGSKVGEFIFKRDRPAEHTDSESIATDLAEERSDLEEENNRPALGRSTTATTTGSLSKAPNKYHVELPSFRSHSEQDPHLADDPITHQSRARANSRSSRFDRLKPPGMDLHSISSKSSPGQPSAASLDRARNDLLYPGDRARGLSITSVDSTFSDTSARSRPHFEGRHWSITDQDTSTHHRRPRRRTATTAPGAIITSPDIARIRALFLSSGVKAREIARRAHEKRSDPPPFLTEAAKAAHAELIPIPRMEEHALAARILVRNLEASTTALQESAERYREDCVQDLTSTISALKSRVESDLFPKVRDMGDEALRITSEVSAAAPLSVKQLSDEIDKMIRMRRRRMRWVRRVGWMLVEWTLLGIMWWVWLVVVCFGLLRRCVGVLWGVVRWLLWI